ncbi:MAG: hypothetical protein ABJA57_04750 [Ginsengibacter sp.]
MKYIIGFAMVLFFIGCTTTRELPDDRYQPVYQQPYGYYNSDPYYAPAYDYSYRDRVYYENNYGNYRPRRQYRYDDRRPQYRTYQQQPQYRVEPRVEERTIIQPKVVQPRDKVYPDGTIKKADGSIIHPGQRDRN